MLSELAVILLCRRCCICQGGASLCAGPPCQDWSTANNRAGHLKGYNGPQLPTMIACGRKCHHCNIKAKGLANVPQLPLELLQLCWGARYKWDYKNVGPEDVGFQAIARPRTLIRRLKNPSNKATI